MDVIEDRRWQTLCDPRVGAVRLILGGKKFAAVALHLVTQRLPECYHFGLRLQQLEYGIEIARLTKKTP
jgi:hypothetical protein